MRTAYIGGSDLFRQITAVRTHTHPEVAQAAQLTNRQTDKQRRGFRMVDATEIKLWGELVGAVRWDQDQQLGFFQYEPNFIKKGWDISPIKMPIANGSIIYSFPELRKGRSETEATFKRLPGLLADALPDKYGNGLINIWLAQQGRPDNSMNPVEKLCFIETRGMGALEFEPAQIKASKNSFSLELNSLVEVAKKMLSQR